MEYYEKLRKIREEQNKSRLQVELNTSIKQNKLSEMEHGRQRLYFTDVIELCNYYNIKITDILDDEQNKEKLTEEEKQSIKTTIKILKNLIKN